MPSKIKLFQLCHLRCSLGYVTVSLSIENQIPWEVFHQFLQGESEQSFPCSLPCLCPSVHTSSIPWNSKAPARSTRSSPGKGTRTTPKGSALKPNPLKIQEQRQEGSRFQNGIRVSEIIQFSFLNTDRINY